MKAIKADMHTDIFFGSEVEIKAGVLKNNTNVPADLFGLAVQVIIGHQNRSDGFR